MNYRNRVQYLCNSLGIKNPIQEDDLIVEAVSFRIRLRWKKVGGTDMNRAGRLFFQYCYACSLKPISSGKRRILSGVTADGLHQIGKYHFGELWDDAEEKGRVLISTFKAAERVRIHFK